MPEPDAGYGKYKNWKVWCCFVSALAAIRRRIFRWKESPVILELVGIISCFLTGLLFSRALAFGKYAPFGIAVAASAPYHYMWAAVAGAMMGYLLPSPILVPVRYLTCILAAAAIRWTLHDLHRISRSQFTGPLAALGPTLATGAAMVVINGSMPHTAALYAAEALLAGGCCWFFQRVWNLPGEGGLRSLTEPDLAGVTIFLCVLALSFSEVTILGVSIGRIAAALFVLYAGRYGGISAGAVAGIAAGAIMGLSSVGLSPLSGSYALGGLMAGIFSPFGKLASAAAFVISNAAASLQAGSSQSLTGLYETAAASVFFVALPAGGRLAALFSSPGETLRSSGLRKSIVMRLEKASQALSGVSRSVDSISQKLTAMFTPDIDGVYAKAASKTCHGCGLRPYCWEKEYRQTIEALESMTDSLRRNGELGRHEVSSRLQDRCARLPDLIKNINSAYQEFLARDAAELRARQVREVAVSQFGITARLLKDLAAETEEFDRFDYEAAQRTGEVLRQAGILPLEVCCRIDRFDRMNIEAETARGDRSHLNKGTLTREISRACGRDLAPPAITMTADKCQITMCERPAYKMHCGAAQHICGGGSLCGDSYSAFTDDFGHQIAIISDGMGTGGRAAVDGAMASGILESLLKSGISYTCAVQLVNAALLAKSGDESLATLDVVCVDLYTATASFYKAGAPVSFVRHNGHVQEVEAPSFPVGILGEAEFAKAEVELEPGDLLVLVSDGVTACECNWVREMMEEWPGGDPGMLAKRMVEKARTSRSDQHDDDITVVALVLESRSGVIPRAEAS